MKNVIISGVIVLIAALLAAPAAVQAQGFQDYDYVTNADNTITITLYTGTKDVVTIPTNITGLPVTSIGPKAFAGSAHGPNSSLISVTIPGSVSDIGDGAFEFCVSLTNATIVNGVTNIGASAFLWCSWLPTIEIPASVTSIGDYAFMFCSSLTNATILNGVTSIGDETFAECIRLASVTIPGSVTNIGNSAFGDSSGLTDVTLPASITSIGSSVFEGCTGLTNVTIPGSVTNIGTNAFEGCYKLAGVTIPGSVTSIGEDAFGFCEELTSVTISGSVTNIGGDAFAQCNSLISVYFTGNAPIADSSLFRPIIGPVHGSTVYYLPGTSGWSNTFAGDPAVLWNPLIQTGDGSFGVHNGQFGFNITGTPNIPIVVEASTSLAGPVWTPLQSLTLTNGSYYFSEPFQPGSPGRFYRITSQ